MFTGVKIIKNLNICLFLILYGLNDTALGTALKISQRVRAFSFYL